MEREHNICNRELSRSHTSNLMAEILHQAMIDFVFLEADCINIYWIARPAACKVNNDWDWVCFDVDLFFTEFPLISAGILIPARCCQLQNICTQLVSADSSYREVNWSYQLTAEQLTTELSPRLSTWNQVKRFLDWQQENQRSAVNKYSKFLQTAFYTNKIWMLKNSFCLKSFSPAPSNFGFESSWYKFHCYCWMEIRLNGI